MELIARINEVKAKVCNSLGDDKNKPGCVLYNGWHTLRPGRIYLMGLNPGGDDKIQIIHSLDDQRYGHKDFSSYDHQKDPWTKSGVEHKHQRRVKEMAAALNIENVAEVFAANAIFVRSPSQAQLPEPWKLWKKCWKVHQYFLSIVRPRIILCLGYGDLLSAFSLLRAVAQPDYKKSNYEPSRQGRSIVKWFMAEVKFDNGQELSPLVIGVPHPSRFPVSEGIKKFLNDEVDKILARNA